MIYAQIKNGTVWNRIVVADESVLPGQLVGFDAIIRVDNLSPQPDIGWSWDGENFSPPIPEEPSE